VMTALSLPKATPEEKAARKAALAEANQGAIAVPFRTMQQAAAAFDLLEAMARDGNPASASDAGVGALCARAAVRGAWLNVRTNLAGVPETDDIREMLTEGERLVRRAEEGEVKVLQAVEGKFAAK
ncbi:MAG: cyclodeaminase/cyclohydrolase family protein, partial [Gemmatimonadota bacterium]|nr:cyclodeaminase/cyclohydrolase family protein [Gemmatimonadota bacterium]